MVTRVCAGLLCRKGELLFAQRSERQSHSGEWEFPGGKVEESESLTNALQRELNEEIGVQISNPVFLFDYLVEDIQIHLHFYLVTAWEGTPHSREGQHVGWYSKEWFTKLDLLPTNRYLLDKLLAELGKYTNLLNE